MEFEFPGVGAQQVEIDMMPEEEDEQAEKEIDELYEKMVDNLIADDGPASPIRTEWPKDSLLKPEHFTIDSQHCLNCFAKLGYAMPMNREPKVKYLFCDHPNCQTANFLKCWACGNFNNENSGHLVHRPGNSAYQGPSQIYSFMCVHCYKDQIENEPGVEETKEMYKKFAAVRRENEKKEFPKLLEAQQLSDGYISSLQESQEKPSSSRKRRKREEEEQF